MDTSTPRLHSRYNPEAEAERYIASLTFKPTARYFILIEPGKGYLIPPLRRRFPAARILALHVEPRGGGVSDTSGDNSAHWFPGMGCSLDGFLEQMLTGADAAAVEIIQWRPAALVYGEQYLRLLTDTAACVKRADASQRTLAAFGRRWVANVFRNLGALRRLAYPARPGAAPVIIAGAGPSLESALPRIPQAGPCLILAVASAVPALASAGIRPNLVLTTDGGGWARLHLYEAFRVSAAGPERAGENTPLAASLMAAVPSQWADQPTVLIADTSQWQTRMVEALGLPFVSLPQRGTVTAQALDLAWVLTTGPVILAGMDLANQDIRSHARPYPFERLVDGSASRLRPGYSQHFARAQALADGGSFSIYAQWFGQHLAAYRQRLYTLGTNHPVFQDVPVWDPAHAGTGAWRGAPLRWEQRRMPPDQDRARDGAALLCRWLAEPHLGAALRAELAPLLAPQAADDASASALAALIWRMATGERTGPWR